MKSVGLICTGVLLLFLGTIAPAYTQSEQQEKEQGKPQQGEPHTPHESSLSHCLPSGIRLDDIVSAKVVGYQRPGNIVRTTVEQTLGKLNAICKNDKLIDASGKEIYFYHLTGCWGNPPEHYNEIFKTTR